MGTHGDGGKAIRVRGCDEGVCVRVCVGGVTTYHDDTGRSDGLAQGHKLFDVLV